VWVWWVLVAAVIGAGVGLLVGHRWTRPAEPGLESADMPDPAHQAELERILAALPGPPSSWTHRALPVRMSKQALAMTMIQNGRIAIPEISAMVADVRRDGEIREHEMTVLRPPLGKGLITLRLRVAPLGPDTVLVLAEDLSEARASMRSAATSSPTSATS
jgi:two-component system sensor histidine kinase SenX3